MAGGSINWFVVIPDGARNFVTNPSFEFGTAGWAGTATPTLGTRSDDQAYGAWALTAAGATLGLGAAAAIANTASGTAYTASAYVRLSGTNSAGSVQINLGGTSFRTQVGTDWTRISVGSVGAVGSVAVQRYSGAEGTLWVDAVQVEVGSITTYVDGDQDGGIWEGAPHASASYRGAQTRSGGSVWPLATVGLRPQTTPDTGMAPTSNILQSYAVNSGAEYQRGRYTERTFTLTATMTGTTLADQHVTRRRVIDAIKRERVAPDQPTRFLYTGAQGTTYIDAYYDAGMGWGGENVIADENAAVRFIAPDPMWYGAFQEGTSLATYTVLGSTNYVAYRDPEGRWGTLGASVNGIVYEVAASNGTLFAGGSFTAAGGTAARAIAQYSGGWGTLVGGTLGGAEASWAVIQIMPANGTLFVGGQFSGVAGTNGTAIAQWTGAGWGTLSGGSIGGPAIVRALAYGVNGEIYAGGDIPRAGGTVVNGIARYVGGAWGTLAGGTLNANAALASGPTVQAITVMSPTVIAVGGVFGGVSGTAVPSLLQWTTAGSWGTFGGGTIAVQAPALALAPDTSLYVAGSIPAYTNNNALVRYRSGNLNVPGSISAVGLNDIVVTPSGGLWAMGIINTINQSFVPSFGLVQWNGYSFLPPDMRLTSSGGSTALRGALSSTGTLYIGGDFTGIGTAASVASVVNSGISESYPTLRLRNTASGTARVYQLLNTTTGDGIWMNYVMSPGEIATLVTTPGNRSFTSSVRGNIYGLIIGGSNIASWRLLPGTNTVSFFADNPSVQADLFWQPRSSSIDGGAPGVI